MQSLEWFLGQQFVWQKVKSSRAWFRSTVLWVMGPARFHCATLLKWCPSHVESIHNLSMHYLWVFASFIFLSYYYILQFPASRCGLQGLQGKPFLHDARFWSSTPQIASTLRAKNEYHIRKPGKCLIFAVFAIKETFFAHIAHTSPNPLRELTHKWGSAVFRAQNLKEGKVLWDFST